ncbi:MAG: NADH-quinone oxidoreductase subunit NuoE [Anaerolineaceae bacterium]|jgi:NADH:ubiquinone oxidoreductase subunit E|nr:NADH-quinone oxidoreductase subunit NuoE [Anaerolineae bacterium]MDP3450841.1 NADH-quinone oxidoreductase subunit NuoE [Anaerolineaceae bacterium]MDP3721078.1 NADH-quinone oxidoreductase subunit NuoE [Anaerolineaceae bacterium]PKO00830.1 MAG: NADH-quinone oxidoreductase subunit NuoE [Chloroflexi bacterium HGW-Chloroflexi-5]
MTIETKDSKVVLEAVQSAVTRYGASQDELIPILNDVNREIGYLPGEALDELSRLLKVPKSQLFSVASFYRMLSTKPRGKHVLQFCESAPCHVAGGREVWLAVKEALKIEENETTPDGKWTLITTSCLGVCGVGPVMMIDDDVIGNVDPAQVPDILAKYQ